MHTRLRQRAVKLLDEQGYAKYLAEPTLTALSGEAAEFHAGGEVQIVTGSRVDDNGQLVSTTEFKKFGTSLKFTPTVKIDGRIKLLLEPEVSSIDNINKYNELDTFDVRRAKTTVEMENNQTLIIAGLYQKRQDRRKKQVPGLGGIRTLGNLFRRSDSRDEETLVLFVVTPSYDAPDEAKQRRSVAAFEAAGAADAKDFYLRGYMEKGFDVNDMMLGVGVAGRFGPMISSGGQGVFRAD
jgi:pilus assembly protein CpaC